MIKWFKSLFCAHNEVITVIYYAADYVGVCVYKEYSCKHCGKCWRTRLSKYPSDAIPSLRQRGIKSVEEIYSERTN